MLDRPRASRPVARATIAAGVILFALVSIPRLRLEYAPDVTFPELAVTLRLPPGANIDSAETTRRWVIPIEGALRSAGDTDGTRGDVGAGSAMIVARFKRGTDVELKAARLASDLAPLRALLPEHASLSVFPASAGLRPNVVLAVAGPDAGDAAERIAEELRTTPGVREVDTSGTTREETDVRLTGDAAVSPATILQELTPRPIGAVTTGSRRLPLVAVPATSRIDDVLVSAPALVRLGAIAGIRRRLAEPASIAQLNGTPAAVINIFRDDDVQLLAFDRAVTRVAGSRATVIWSDAAELKIILQRLLMAALIATLILMIGGGPWLGLYVPLAAALVINVWRVASIRIDEQTLLVTAIAIAAVGAFAAARSVSRTSWPLIIAAFFVILLPIAAVLGSGALSPLLGPPARGFAIAACCALAAAFFVRPRRSIRRSDSQSDKEPCSPARLTSHDAGAVGLRVRPTYGSTYGPAYAVKRLLRNSASVVLASLAAGVFLLSWFGARLDPRRSEGSSDRSRVFVRMQMPSGTTLGRTSAAVRAVEDVLRRLPGVKSFWTFASAGSASVVIDLQPSLEQTQRYDLFLVELNSRLPRGYGSISVQTSFGGGSSSALAESIEEQPYADESGSSYRFLIKGTDADALRRTYEALITRLGRNDIPRRSIHGSWPDASPRIELVPSRTIAPGTADAMAAVLARRTLLPPEDELPDGTVLRVAASDAPRAGDDVPRRDVLFARPMVIGDRMMVVENAFGARTSSTEGAVTRELGRFVLPVEVMIGGQILEQAIAKREEVDRSISLAVLPPGVIVERPELGSWNFSASKMRLAAVAAFLPLLLITAAAIALSSLVRAAVAMAPAAIGVAFVAPVLAAVPARLDEITLLAAGAAVCCTAAFTVVTLLRIGGGGTGRTYRVLRREARPAVIAAIAGGTLLLVAATAHPAIGDAWRAPLLAAATVVIIGIPAGLILPGAIDALLRDARRRRGKAARAMARPGVWSDTAAVPHIAVRNLTKVYASGFRALHRVSFDLTPGVIGLLGPNGAGKTTLLRMLTGLLRPARGVIEYRGVPVQAENLAEFRRSIGFLPQEFNAYAGLTAVQFLDFWALERGMEDPRARRAQTEELLAAVGLEEHAGRRVRDFSGGMRQRIGIARALLSDPPLLIVDEPTTGLDIEARHRFRDLLTVLAKNRIVILSSHIASDVETTATRLLLLSQGELRWQGPVEALLARARGRVFETIVTEAELRQLSQRYRITARVRVAEGIRIRGVAVEGEPLPGDEAQPTLEEAYLSEVSTGEIRRGSFAFVFAR
jgi:ABC-2 type transport system ATP-binding protein